MQLSTDTWGIAPHAFAPCHRSIVSCLCAVVAPDLGHAEPPLHPIVVTPKPVTIGRCYHKALLPQGCVTTRRCYHKAMLQSGCVTTRLRYTDPCCIPSILFTHRPICCAWRGLMFIASKTHVGNHRCHRRHRSVGFLQRQKLPKSIGKAIFSSK